MDVEGHIKPGDDFVAVLNAQVAACDVLLAVIGPRWSDLLTARPATGASFAHFLALWVCTEPGPRDCKAGARVVSGIVAMLPCTRSALGVERAFARSDTVAASRTIKL
jgi:hypothetical protein